ncbi:MAG: RES domain-containing protein [Geobacteraceae bacterium]|nr:RES domain-containing protein [Geobacteraceae bacterium]
MCDVFCKLTDFRQDVHRNIVSLRESQDLFDDLRDGDPELSSLAIGIETRVEENIPKGFIERGFHYSQAIGYPFDTQPFMASRYGDGNFGVWYGSVERLVTTIFESTYHMIQYESNIEGLNEIVDRERAVNLIFCEAILFDLVGKEKAFPQLLSNDYSFTQSIGTAPVRLQSGRPFFSVTLGMNVPV